MRPTVVPSAPRLGRLVGAVRANAGITQAELAEAAGVSRTWLIHFEAGKKRRAQMDTVFKVLRTLDCEMVIQPRRRRDF
ncbi:helix-turn-helix transcriptional regulator [Candidatus Poriferisocius sp.]|uniref:helix-turn-helix transcriptional regulator n=1 Tax=Candidatus Poriferisocius sp. TaxID=3101276 RepID=UPI003B5BAB79